MCQRQAELIKAPTGNGIYKTENAVGRSFMQSALPIMTGKNTV